MRNYIALGEVTRELDRRSREEANRAALQALPGQIALMFTGILIGFLIGIAVGMMK